MNKIIVLNGPNLNLLGEREKKQYGSLTLKEIENNCKEFANKNNIKLSLFQSNIEGELITQIQNARNDQDGIICGLGSEGYTLALKASIDLIKK